LLAQGLGETNQRVQARRVGEGELRAVDEDVTIGGDDLVDVASELRRGRHVELTAELDVHTAIR